MSVVPIARRVAAAALAVGLATAAWPQAPPAQPTRPGLPAQTTAGRFDGTWIYKSRDFVAAIWLRQASDGAPELRFRYRSNAVAEEFETDWSGGATYSLADRPATFALRLVEGNADEARGTWDWSVKFASAAREETGTFRMYRGLDGRQLVFEFDAYTRTIQRGDNVRRYDFDEHAMTFLKASKRLVLWEELPF